MNKKDPTSPKPNSKERLSIILQILEESSLHEVKRTDLIAQTGFSSATLCTDLQKLNQAGLVETPPRSGLIRLIRNESDSSAKQAATFESFGKKDVSKWILLSQTLNGQTDYQNIVHKANRDLFEEGESFFSIKDSTKSKYLTELEKEGLITRSIDFDGNLVVSFSKNSDYVLLKTNPSIISTYQDLFRYSGKSMGHKDILQHFFSKVDLLEQRCLYEESENDFFYYQGKETIFSDELLQKLAKFLGQPFRTHLLSFLYTNNQKETSTIFFRTALLFYSVEQGQFYLLGEKLGEREPILLRLSNIDTDTIVPQEGTSPVFTDEELKKYEEIYEQMFSASLDSEPMEVEVHFVNFGNTGQKVASLQEVRKFASTSLLSTEEQEYIIYKDTVRGLEDFARYLRMYGRAAKVIKPEALKQRMITSASNVLSIYEQYKDFTETEDPS